VLQLEVAIRNCSCLLCYRSQCQMSIFTTSDWLSRSKYFTKAMRRSSARITDLQLFRASARI